MRKSSVSPRSRKVPDQGESGSLKTELARIEREQAKLNRLREKVAETIADKAKEAAEQAMPKKRKKRKPTKRKWKAGRPPIPYPDFPLSPHANGRWQKKILGKIYYFGRWGKIRNGKMERIPGDGWQEALTLYNAQKDDHYAGRTPRVESDGLTIRDLCNRFLTVKKHALDAGDLSPRTFAEYQSTAERLASTFGRDRLVTDLASDDFESLLADISKQWGPYRRGNEVQRTRTIFKYGYEAGLIDKPVRYGPSFKKPSKAVIRKHRSQKQAANGKRMFEADELRKIIDAASQPLKAMILLGINCGFGQSDISHLPKPFIDLENGWIDFPRPKTGVERKCPLWPETVEALSTAIASRPKPKAKGDADLAFITVQGNRWVRTTKHGNPDDAVGKEFGKVLRSLKLKRAGVNFYALRHTFETIGGEVRDQVAVNAIMGHADSTMAAVYREHISDERLKAVVGTVRQWLFPPAPKAKRRGK